MFAFDEESQNQPRDTSTMTKENHQIHKEDSERGTELAMVGSNLKQDNRENLNTIIFSNNATLAATH